MKIFFEDEAIIVVLKPAGVLSEAANTNSFLNDICEYTSSAIYPVHRLDKETAGIMVFAKTKFAAAKLSAQITDKKFIKEYIAIIHNDINPDKAELIDFLFRDAKKNKSYVVKRERKGVRKAELSYEKLSFLQNTDYGPVSIIKVKLKTGRTHQIRVQFASRGYSLLGDKRYGAKDTSKNLGLFAYKLSFFHPITKKELLFTEKPDTLCGIDLNPILNT